MAVLAETTAADDAATYQEYSIHTENRTPLVSLFAIARGNYEPQWQPGHNSGPSGTAWQLFANSELTNYFDASSKQNQQLIIDGETLIHHFKLDYRASKSWRLGIESSWIRHSAGQLDSFIYNWHDFFGLPQNGRSPAGNQQFRIRMTDNGSRIIDLQSAQSGWGDSRLNIAYVSDRWQLAGFVKAPTGEVDRLTGSGAWDFGFSAASGNPDWFRQRNWLTSANLAVWYGAGLSYLGSADDLAPLKQNHFVISGRLGMGWNPSGGPWSLQVQLDSNSAVFDSDIMALGSFPIELSLGTRYQLSHQSSINLKLVEDARPGASPDVSLALGLRVNLY